MCAPSPGLEVSLALTILHRRLCYPIVGPSLTAFGDPRGGDLVDDRFERRRAGGHGARAGHVADGAVPHRGLERLLAVDQLHELAVGVEHAVAAEHLARMREVDRWNRELLLADVLPYIELGPVGDREHPDVLALADLAVVQRPQLGPLALGIPLAELVAEREHALLGSRPLLVAPGAAERGVEAVLCDRVQQRGGLKPIAGRAWARLLDHPA